MKGYATSRLREGVSFSLLKSFSWRLLATADTLILAWAVTGELSWAVSIGAAEFLAKFGMYFLHERLWSRVRWGKRPGQVDRPLRSLGKALSWRVFATLTTVGLALLIIGEQEAAWSIGGLELVSKLLLYYLHERLWSGIAAYWAAAQKN